MLVADAVRLVLGDQARLDDVGEMVLQGFVQPRRVHRLLAFGEAADHGAGPLIGRDAELAQLTALLADLAGSGGGRLVMLRADAGVGKSRLVRELERRAREHGR